MTRHAVMFLLFVFFFLLLPSKKVFSAYKTENFIVQVIQKIKQGDLKGWKIELEKADRVFEREKQKIPFQRRYSYQLWLHQIWSQYYLKKVAKLKIKDLNEFHNKKELKEYINDYEKKIESIKKALGHLVEYTSTLNRFSMHSTMEELALQVALSQERDLRQEIGDHKVYLTLLKTILARWKMRDAFAKKVTEIKIKLNEPNRVAHNNKEKLKKIRLAEVNLSKQLNHSRIYLKKVIQMDRRKEKFSRKLIYGGIGGLALGGVSFLGGVIFSYLSSPDGPWASETEPSTKQLYNNLFVGSMILGSVAVVAGGAAIVSGMIIKPNRETRQKNIIEVQNQYWKGLKKRHSLKFRYKL